ncbi:hypothetical protein M011DRAFT_474364 [Sporormia fimetaria CBS 119925]|uniref:PH domain-containing protein n=1 Tax=Sporormia fimetaria CBS 119925 TaxID=1340428 RepID=A0A6A6VJS4_9PLEO|nr:hypothetical protein M011DRAFT_474364 [Sporormia fimetaria CBS 119925]
MSEWGGGSPHRRTASSTGGPSPSPAPQPSSAIQSPTQATPPNASSTVLASSETPPQSPASIARSESRPSSRPMSMIQTYQPPVMEVSQDTLPELQRIFTFLNSHSNKLYQEGFLLKFHDTDSRGRPAPDRVWQECFGQLVGTILSLWDASELDQSDQNAQVLPTFINLTDAAIHMMPSMVLNDGKKLDNVLSVSTAASNKYLFHFNSYNSLTQWTAGIRLAMYEHATLQEAYTGALIAGKGKSLNNIRMILDRQRAKHEDWARVRFGAGTPWRRCWCVVNPPDEKEYAKLQKAEKKSDIYKRSTQVLKGDIRFYDTKKVTKKTRPIATVTDAYSCYAIYPQSKPLIDQSTLVKIEGKIKIHAKPDKVTEGFVFVMPETHPAVSGFEIMLRFLFPVFDTFALYGRPQKLVADVLDTRGLMFAMPSDRRYGYLEMWDVVSLINTEGSQTWSERQWRRQLKELTSKRMLSSPSRMSSRASRASVATNRRNTLSRTSLPPSRTGTLRFEGRGPAHSQPSTRQASPSREDGIDPRGPRRVDTAPPTSSFAAARHQRSQSEAFGYKKYQAETPSRLAHGVSVGFEPDEAPTPPEHRYLNGGAKPNDGYDTMSDSDRPSPDTQIVPELRPPPTELPHDPVERPPSFAHAPGQRPPVQPYQPPSTMKPNAHIDSATLDQLADATHAPLPAGIAAAGAAAAWRGPDSPHGRRSGDFDRDRLHMHSSANSSRSGTHGSRLPTIPASPYVEQTEYVASPATYQPTGPPVPEHAEIPQSQLSADLAHPSRPDSSGNQVHRKPLPGRSSSSPSRGEIDNRSITSSSLGSLRNVVVDPDALDSLDAESSLIGTNMSVNRSDDDDALSTTTPDYASTISEDREPRKLPARYQDRPRSGMLKTVGDPTLKPKSDAPVGDALLAADIPAVDFGPTYVMDPSTKRPGTSGTLTQAMHDSTFSKSRERLAPSPSEQQRQSWLSGRATPNGALHTRSSSTSPGLSQGSRMVPWQPTVGPRTPEGLGVEADEWVAQRSAAASRPMTSPAFGHSRSKSHTPPPFHRTPSGDWSQLQRGADGLPLRPPSRPHSRGAANLLDQRPTSLSAREQEHVARMTGTPLIDLAHSSKKPQNTSAEGLTGYIDHREREKARAKGGRNTAAVQAEVDRRMMAAQHRQMMDMQQQMGQTMPMQGGYAASTMGQTMPMQGGYAASTMGFSPGYQQAYAYSTPDLMSQIPGYFPQTPGQPQGMNQRWGTPSPQPTQGAYFPPPQQQPIPRYPPPPQQVISDQAQAAARTHELLYTDESALGVWAWEPWEVPKWATEEDAGCTGPELDTNMYWRLTLKPNAIITLEPRVRMTELEDPRDALEVWMGRHMDQLNTLLGWGYRIRIEPCFREDRKIDLTDRQSIIRESIFVTKIYRDDNGATKYDSFNARQPEYLRYLYEDYDYVSHLIE